MGRLALIKDGKVKNICLVDDKTGDKFLQSVAAENDAVLELEDADFVGNGFEYSDGKFIEPIEPAPIQEVPADPVMDKLDVLAAEIAKLSTALSVEKEV